MATHYGAHDLSKLRVIGYVGENNDVVDGFMDSPERYHACGGEYRNPGTFGRPEFMEPQPRLQCMRWRGS